MAITKLFNLGPFNDCIDVISPGCAARYGPIDGGKVSCYPKDGVVSRIGVPTGSDEITVPMFMLGLAAHYDTSENRTKLIRAIELKIFTMIYQMANKFNMEVKLQNIVIPIKSVCFEFDSRNRFCVRAILGIAMFENSMVKVPN